VDDQAQTPAAPRDRGEAERPAEVAGEPSRAAMVHPSITDAALIARWQSVARSAAELGPVLRGVVTNCTLVRFAGGKAVLECPDRLRTAAVKQAAKLGELFGREMGTPVVVEIFDPAAEQPATTDDGSGAGDASDAAAAASPEAGATAGGDIAGVRPDPMMATEHPLVKQAVELFQARVVDVQPRKG